ncbi:HD domain-containing protein [Pseudonocardiaceae bacterium YIM PH 21723]|nr:HD domain-containing protein [Pseudonocardiaceae bacterium YIM PH 21723]
MTLTIDRSISECDGAIMISRRNVIGSALGVAGIGVLGLPRQALAAVPDLFPVPDSRLVKAATALMESGGSPVFTNHSQRVYQFGALLLKKAGIRSFDRELAYLGCILHDLAWTPKFKGPEEFMYRGANMAGEFLSANGVGVADIKVVQTAIINHTDIGALDPRPEVQIVELGAVCDFNGVGVEFLDARQVRRILDYAPRLDCKNEAIATMDEEADKHPLGRIACKRPLFDVMWRNAPFDS